jgi:outer membrane receptor for ferric coprogen and ferric-rhodotorulic acid
MGLRLLLLTGVRTCELRMATPDQFDLERDSRSLLDLCEQGRIEEALRRILAASAPWPFQPLQEQELGLGRKPPRAERRELGMLWRKIFFAENIFCTTLPRSCLVLRIVFSTNLDCLKGAAIMKPNFSFRRMIRSAKGRRKGALTRLARRVFMPLVIRRSAALLGTFLWAFCSEPIQAQDAIPQTQSDSISLPAPSAANETTLPEVTVSAQGERDTLTENTGSYTTGATTTATKLPLALRETPQTITVITRQQMDDFGLNSVNKVLESTSGVFVSRYAYNGEEYYSRGFKMQNQYDGLSSPVIDLNASPDSAFLDHMEVLQGASGLLSGVGEPGGTVNMVRKKPTRAFQSHVEAQLGSWNKKRLVGDISGPLLDSGRVRARLVALVDNSDFFVDHMYDDKQGIYGAISADLTETTTLDASVQYQKNKSRNYFGVPTAPDGRFLDFSRSIFFGDINQRSEKENLLYTLGLEQKLSEDWSLKFAYQHSKTEVGIGNGNYFMGGPLDVATGDGLFLAQYHLYRRELTSDTLDVYASGPVQILGRQHEFVLGASNSRIRDKAFRLGGGSTLVNIYDFNPYQIPAPTNPNVASFSITPSVARQQGGYGVARLNLADSLKLILGARVSWYEYENSSGRTQDENAVVSPYAGIIYDLNDHYSVYASYSDIFKPQSNLSRSGNPIDPVIGTNYEAGIKGEFLNGRLNAAAAIFRLEQINLAKQDEAFGYDTGNVCSGWCYIAQGKVISQGVDFSFNGELATGWNVGAGYTYVKSEYASGTEKGDPYNTTVPTHAFRAFSTYRIPGTGWTVGGNVRAQNQFYKSGTSNNIAYRIKQGGIALVGLMAQYRINPQAEISINVENLLDRKYYSNITAPTYYNIYGEPRRVLTSLKYQF